MHDLALVTTAITHHLYRAALQLAGAIGHAGHEAGDGDGDHAGDRGAVTLEQVLWFVAAGVSVAVIAAILWGKITDEANQPVTRPTAP